MPGKIRWEINSECNLRCIHCFAADNQKKDQMSLKRQLHTIEILHREGIREVVISSREPLLSKNINSIIRSCKDKEMHTTVLTNGTLLSDYEFAYEFVDSGVDAVAISIEGITSRSNDYIRGKGVLKRVKEAISNLNKASVELDKPISIIIQFLLHPINVHECMQLVNEINEWNITTLTVGNIASMGNAKEHPEIILGYEKYVEACEQLLYFYMNLPQKKYYIKFKSLSIWDELLLGFKTQYRLPAVISSCSVFDNVFSIMPDGKIFPCIMLEEKIPPNIFISPSEINSMGNYLSAKVEELLVDMKCDYCVDCYFINECKLCPALDINSEEFLIARRKCAEGRKQFNDLFEAIMNNIENYTICFTDTLININKDMISFYSYYSDGSVNEYTYAKNKSLLKLLEQLAHGKTIIQVLYECQDDTVAIQNIIYDLLVHGMLNIVEDKNERIRMYS